MSNYIQLGQCCYYYGLDGDGIKAKMESYTIGGDVDTVSNLSKQLTSTLDYIEREVIHKGGDVKYCGGDNILFFAQLTLDDCQKLLDLFYSQTGLTASLGIGATITDVYLSLRFAKSFGGGKIIFWLDRPVYISGQLQTLKSMRTTKIQP